MNFKFNVVLLLGAFLMISCSNDTKSVEQKIYKPVKYAAVVQVGGEIIKSFNGTSQSGAETNLSFRTNGLIVKINVKVGETVKKGQLLAQLDLKDFELNYQKAKSSLQSAHSQVETAKSSFQRIKELYQSNSVSLSDYEQAKNSYFTAQSSYETAKKTLDLQASQITYAKIIAPTNGFVSAVNAEINEFASAGNPLIVINSDKEDIEVKIGVTENYISKILNGQDAEIKFTAIPDKSFKGTVTEVGFASAQTATSPVVLKLTEIAENMRPGMPVEVIFSFGNKNEKSTLSVPVAAVGEDHEGTFVYALVQLDDKIYKTKKTIVQTGKLTNEGYEVLNGLQEGEYVATAGLRSLFDGMEVQLLH